MPDAPDTTLRDEPIHDDDRTIPVESVVEHLTEITPEQLLEEHGPAFVESVDRYLRLFDAPLVRRLPIIREVVAYQENGPAESVAFAANALGHGMQGVLSVINYVADLQATISPPLFLDRLGAAIVQATQRPAKRLLSLGTAFLVLFLVVDSIAVLSPARGIVVKLQALLGWPVIVLGVVCLAFWILGEWFRQDRQPGGRLLRPGGRGPVRHARRAVSRPAAATTIFGSSTSG